MGKPAGYVTALSDRPAGRSALALFLGIFHAGKRARQAAAAIQRRQASCPSSTEHPMADSENKPPLPIHSLSTSSPGSGRGTLPEATAHTDSSCWAGAATEIRSGNRHHHDALEHLLCACAYPTSLPIDRRHAPRTFPRIRSLPPIFLFNRSLQLGRLG